MSDKNPTLEPAPVRVVAPGRVLGTVTVDIVEVAGELRYRARTEPAVSLEVPAEVLFVMQQLLVTVATMGVAPDTDADTDTDDDG